MDILTTIGRRLIIEMSNRIILYSHGFGVQKDDRGLFTDIASKLPEFEHVMFDYNYFDAESNTMSVSPLDVQAKILKDKISEVKKDNPEAKLYIVAHSQGCIVTALAGTKGFEEVIFLAPPTSLSGASSKVKEMLKRIGTTRNEDGSVSYPRRDGSTTIVTSDYLRSREGVNPVEEFNKLSENNSVHIINATEDEVLVDVDFSKLSKDIEVIELSANHDFKDDAREEVIKVIQSILCN